MKLFIHILAFWILIATTAAADDPGGAPPYLACHAKLHVKGVPTCTDKRGPKNHPKFWPIEVCRPNECMLRVYEVAPASSYVYTDNPSCGSNVSQYTKDAIAQLAEAYVKNPEAAKELAGRVAGPLTKAASEFLRKTNGFGDIGRYVISPYQNNNSVCVPVVATIPKRAKVTRYALGASDTDQDESNGTGVCYDNPSCQPRAWSAFEDFKITKINPQGPTFVSATFKNWRHDKGRRAVMVIWFTPPPSRRLIKRTD